jgi:hypothetical protein
METYSRMSDAFFRQIDLAERIRNSGLPVNVTQADCDGPPDSLADADDRWLWRACDPAQQQDIVTRFALNHTDELRDAILELEDGPCRSQDSGRAASLGSLVWRAWIAFRDQALRELHRRGEIRS